MIRLLSGLPRPNGVGEYVSHLTQVGLPTEVFYRRLLTPPAFEETTGGRPGPLAAVLDWGRMRRQPAEAIARTHVTWEGLGPVYGPRTRLLTVHHVLGPPTPWERSAPGRGQRAMVFALARRGHRRSVRFGTRLVVPSSPVRDDLVRFYGADPARVEVVPHFIDPQLFQPLDPVACRRSLGLPTDTPVLLHLGVDDGRKNIGGLLTLFHRFRQRHPGSVLVQIGRSSLVESALRGPEGAALRYRPAVTGSERPRWYSAADAVVLPTFQEGFGRAALEALACGTPAVVSDLPVFREELGERFRGAEVGRWDDWVAAIEGAIAGRDVARDRGLVVAHFGHAAFADAYRRLYRETLAG